MAGIIRPFGREGEYGLYAIRMTLGQPQDNRRITLVSLDHTASKLRPFFDYPLFFLPVVKRGKYHRIIENSRWRVMQIRDHNYKFQIKKKQEERKNNKRLSSSQIAGWYTAFLPGKAIR
jgi:hypothetical protein